MTDPLNYYSDDVNDSVEAESRRLAFRLAARAHRHGVADANFRPITVSSLNCQRCDRAFERNEAAWRFALSHNHPGELICCRCVAPLFEATR